jgi:microcystin-dependent protein
MGQYFLGEIRIMSFNFAPKNWAMCNGQFLPINQNQALFSLLGTTYGGNGQTTFALPDLRGQVPIHFGKNTQGTKGGEPAHTLAKAEMPAHTHTLSGSKTQGDKVNPNFGGTGYVLAQDPGNCYSPTLTPNGAAFNPASVLNVGGSQPHENRQPFLTLTFCISLVGIFPSRN